SLPELVAWMKSSQAKFAHAGAGGSGHLTSVLFLQSIGVKLELVPYNGAAPLLRDLLGGHIDMYIGTTQQLAPQVSAGAVRAFGITTGEPPAQLPGVASLVKEYGPKLEVLFWHMMLAPAGTPRPIVNALNVALQDALEDPEILGGWAKGGVAPYPK